MEKEQIKGTHMISQCFFFTFVSVGMLRRKNVTKLRIFIYRSVEYNALVFVREKSIEESLFKSIKYEQSILEKIVWRWNFLIKFLLSMI